MASSLDCVLTLALSLEYGRDSDVRGSPVSSKRSVLWMIRPRPTVFKELVYLFIPLLSNVLNFFAIIF